MKRKLALAALILLIVQSLTADDFVTIHSQGPGTLQLTTEALLANRLRVTGHIDARDFSTLKKVTINRTRELDLSQAVIDAYEGNGGSYESLRPDWIVSGTGPAAAGGSGVTRGVTAPGSGDEPFEGAYPANRIPIHAFCEMRDNSLSKFLVGSSTLWRLILPATLEGFQADALAKCSSISELVLPEGSRLRGQENAQVYSTDGKRLLAVAPGYTGGLDLPSTVESIAGSALSGVRLTHIVDHSGRVPECVNLKSIDAAYVLTADPEAWQAVLPNADCVEEIREIRLENVQEGTLMERLGNEGYGYRDVRSLTVLSGTLGSSDLESLLALPNLHHLDLSRASTSAEAIALSGSKLTRVGLPQGGMPGYRLTIYSSGYLQGVLSLPEGVTSLRCESKRFSGLKGCSTLEAIGKDAFKGSLLQHADLSACTRLRELEAFDNCPHLTELLLPHGMTSFTGAMGTGLESITLPATLTKITGFNDAPLREITLPASLTSLSGFCHLPALTRVDASSCTLLTSLSGFTGCPLLEDLDLGMCPITTLSGLGADMSWPGEDTDTVSKPSGGPVSSGGTRHPAPDYCGLRKVRLPATLTSLDAFNHAAHLHDLDLSHCTSLTRLYGLYGTTQLHTLRLPAGITDVSGCYLTGYPCLRHLYTSALTPHTLPSMLSREALAQVTAHVPSGKRGTYAMTQGWGDCKEIVEAGYVVTVDVPSGVPASIAGSGLYPEGQSVTLTALSCPCNALQDWEPQGWYIGDTYHPGASVTFTPDTHVTATPSYAQGKPHLERGDVCFTIESPVDTVLDMSLAYYSYHADGVIRSFAFYSEQGSIYSSNGSNGSYDTPIPLHAGTNRFALTGSHLEFELRGGEGGRCMLRDFAIHAPEALSNLTLTNLHIEGTLDLSGCTGLRYFYGNNSHLTGIDVSQCSELETLFLAYNQLSELNLSHCTKLSGVELHCNQLSSLDLSHCDRLQWLSLYENSLTGLDLSRCSKLVNLSLNRNQLSEVDLSNCTELEVLYLSDNQFSELDLSECSKLRYVVLDNNQLSRIGLNHNDSLRVLFLYNNSLSEIDLSHCGALRNLFVGGNRLKELDLSACPLLESVDYGNNKLRSVKMPHDQVSMGNIEYNPIAFAQFTPGLYDLYVKEHNYTQGRTAMMKADEESLRMTGTWDFTAELTANAEARDTEFRFGRNGYTYVPKREGNTFYFEPGARYGIYLTNPHYPLLEFYAYFEVPEVLGVGGLTGQGITYQWEGGNRLLIKGLCHGDEVSLYGTDGTLLCSGTAEASTLSLDIAAQGRLFVLKVLHAGRPCSIKVARL